MRTRRYLLSIAVLLALAAVFGGIVVARRLSDFGDRQDRADRYLDAARRWESPGERKKVAAEIARDADAPASLRAALSEQGVFEQDATEAVVVELREAARRELRRTSDLASSLAVDLARLGIVGGPLLCAALAGLLIAFVYRPLDRAGRARNPEAAARRVARVSGDLAQLLETLDRERAERMLDLLRTGQLAAMGNLTAGVAHDLRTPLMAASGWVESAERRIAAGETDDLPELLRRVHAEIERANGMIRDLLAIAPRESDVPSRFDLVQEIEESARQVIRRAALDERVIAVESPGPVVIEGRPRNWRRILFNLIENAVESVTADHAPRPGDVRIRIVAGPSPTVEVVDRGGGFDPIDAPDPDVPYRTTKENGTGLGLFVASGLSRNEGYVLALSSPGVGRGARVLLEPVE